VPIYSTTGAFIAPASRTAVSLRTLANTAYSAGADLTVSLPIIAPPANANVGVGVRNKGAAIGAVGYAKLLNYPNVAGSYLPADPGFSAPGDPVQQPGGAGDTGKLLADWNDGVTNAVDANGTPLNTLGNTLWGLALNSADKLNTAAVPASGVNASAANDWRYIKIDGAAPTLENVFAGNYPYWAEGELLSAVKDSSQTEALLPVSPLPTQITAHKNAKKAILAKFAKDLGNDAAVATTVNSGLATAWGVTGIFPTTVTDSTAVTAIPNGKVSVFEHDQAGNVKIPRVGVVPVPRSSTASPTVILQLK
jgi:hypothetical protein